MQPTAKLGIVCAALTAGEAIGFALFGWASLWPAFMGLALIVAIFGFGYRVKFWYALFFLILGLALFLRAADARRQALAHIEICNWRISENFKVLGEPRIGTNVQNGSRWVSFPTECAIGRIQVVFSQSVTNTAPQIGEEWSCTGWLSRNAQSRRTPCLWVKGRGTRAVRVSAASPHAPVAWLARARRTLSRRLGLGLDDRPLIADLNRAMVLGERAALPWEMRQDFVRSGTLHVFAISGLHVMVVAQLILYVLVVTAFSVRWAGLILIPMLWLYVALIGAPASAVRAAAMASVYFSAPFFYCRPNSMIAWEVTLLFFALIDPIGLFAVGSMLSFAVVFGILLFARWAKPFHSRILVAVGFPFAAWAAGVPIAAHVFSRITPGGLFANLIQVPLAGAAVTTSILGAAASFVSDALAEHVNNLAALFTQAMAGVSWAVARIPGADFEIAPWPITLGVAWYAGIILLFVWLKMVWTRRHRTKI